jgi:GNAT superfamily N-acetyltransferase
MTKRCEIRQLDMGGKNEFFFELVCGGERQAAIHAARKKVAGKVRFVVAGVNVLESFRRQGLATKLYEAAAQEACRRRAPLASYERIGDMSRHFWDKQMRKGRAVILSKRGGYERGEKAPIFSLTCPATSLKGSRVAVVARPSRR